MITSMVEGRIRLRSPHFKDPDLARRFAELAVAVPGMLEVTVNPLAGSALLLYDPAELPTETLMGHAETLAALMPPLPEKAGKASGRSRGRSAGKHGRGPYALLLGRQGRAMVVKGLAMSFAATLATGYVRRRWHPALGWLLLGLTGLHFLQTRR